MIEEILNSTWFQVIIFLVLLAAVSKVLQLIVSFVLKHFTAYTKTEKDDIFAKKISKSSFWIFMLLGIYFFNNFLVHFISAPVAENILLTILLIFVARIIIGTINLVIEIWGFDFATKVRSGVDDQLLSLAHGIVTFVLYVLAFIYILTIWDVEILPVLGSLGVAGLAVALALQEPLQNLFGGIQILLDRNLKKGDIVELSSGESGTIQQITLRSTRLRTWDGKLVIIPNKTMANDRITNISLPDKKRRVSVPFGVEYGTDPDYVKAVILDEMSKLEKIEKEDPAPMVLFESMADSALTFEAKCWVNELSDFLSTKQELIVKIYDRLNFEGIGIPFPQQTVWWNDASKVKHVSYAKKEFKGTLENASFAKKKTAKKSSKRGKK